MSKKFLSFQMNRRKFLLLTPVVLTATLIILSFFPIIREREVERIVNVMDPHLEFYAPSNAKLLALPPISRQVVFIGDSLTQNWDLAKFFPGKPYVNRGIGGQFTPQILLRFRPDAINLKPDVIVLLAGINDITFDIGDNQIEIIKGNLASMAELARMHGSKVIIGSLMPTCGIFIREKPLHRILEINEFLHKYCQETGSIYVDYYSVLAQADGILREEFTYDCIHMNAEGYDTIAPLVEEAIKQALGKNVVYA